MQHRLLFVPQNYQISRDSSGSSRQRPLVINIITIDSLSLIETPQPKLIEVNSRGSYQLGLPYISSNHVSLYYNEKARNIFCVAITKKASYAGVNYKANNLYVRNLFLQCKIIGVKSHLKSPTSFPPCYLLFMCTRAKNVFVNRNLMPVSFSL